jgi:hypothetical protein
MSSSAQRDESLREWVSYIPALLTATGVVLYGMLGTAYSLFYGRLGVNPEDVGLGYAATISRSTGFVLIAVCLSALVLLPALWTYIQNRGWRRATERRAEANRRAAQVILERAGGAEALKEAPKSGEASMVLDAVGQHMAAAREAEAWKDRPRHSQRGPLLFAIAALLLVLMPLAPLLAFPRANEVKRGQEVSPVKSWGSQCSRFGLLMRRYKLLASPAIRLPLTLFVHVNFSILAEQMEALSYMTVGRTKLFTYLLH